MYKLDLEKAEEPENKLPTSIGAQEKQESSRKTPIQYTNAYIGEGNGNPLQYSCLENPIDGEAW